MSQRQFIEKKLKEDGFVSRNFALKHYISRLSAIILDLKHDGWNLTGRKDGGDYLYEVKGSPFKEVIYKLPDGTIIKKYERK